MRTRAVSIAVAALTALGLCELAYEARAPQAPPAADTPNGSFDTPNGSFVVTSRDPGTDLASLAARHGLRLVRALPALRAAVLEGPAAADTLPRLQADPQLSAASPNLWFQVAGGGCCEGATLEDPHAAFDHVRQRLAASWGPLTRRIQGDPEVVVAVLDTGVDAGHPDLGPALVPGVSLIADAPPDADLNGHGSAMASLIGGRARPDGHGIEGIAAGVSILPVRLANPRGRATLARVAEGIVSAVDRGADVVLLSLGARRPSPLLEAAVDYAEARGVLLVAAAGNRNTHADLFPAADPRVLSVACVDDDGQLALSTALAPTTDLLAPGVEAPAAVVLGGWGLLSGSSVSAARVAAVAALVRGARPELTPAAVRALLRHATAPLALFAGEPDLQRAFPAGVLDPQRLVELLAASAPQLELSDPRVLPARAPAGEPVRYRVRATNPGLLPASAATLRIEVDGALVASFDAAPLAPGESRLLEVHAPARPGAVRFALDDAQATTTLAAGAPPRDLALSRVVAEPRADGSLALQVSVEGRGVLAAGRVGGRVGQLPLLPRACGPLAAGETAELEFVLEPSTLQVLPELFAVELSLCDPDDDPSNDAAVVDLEVPGVGPRAARTQYQQNARLNLVCDAPFRLEPGRSYLPLLVFVARRATSTRTRPWSSTGRGSGSASNPTAAPDAGR